MYALTHPWESLLSFARPEMCGGHQISSRTVPRILKRYGVRSYASVTKPLLIED